MNENQAADLFYVLELFPNGQSRMISEHATELEAMRAATALNKESVLFGVSSFIVEKALWI